MKRLLGICSVFIALLLLFIGCGGGYVNVKMVEPAEYFLPGVKTLAVSNFTSVRSYFSNPKEEFADALNQAIVENGFYKVIERSQLKKILQEQQLTFSGLVEEDASRKLGSLLGADAIITGNISDYSFKDGGEWKKEKRYNKEKKKHYYVKRFNAFRNARAEVNIKVIDVKTGQIMLSKTFTKKANKNVKKASRMDAIKALPSGKELLSGIKNNIVRTFVNKIAPHKVYRRERILSGKDERFKSTVKFAQGGLWDNAIPIWKDIAENGIMKDKKAAYYNLAIAYQARGDYDTALNYIDEALKYGADDIVISKKSQLKQLKKKRQELINQLQNR